MFPRLFRSLIAFGIVLVLYQVYVLVAAPLLAPSSFTKASGGLGLPTITANPVEKFQKLLSAYFPAGHWSLTGKPIVIESGQMMMVLDDYDRDDRGRVDIARCAMLFFPTPRQSRGAPPRDAVIVEAPEGAKLQFDRDFNPARGKVGRIVLGQFPGRITIRSDMSEPGAADDLEITTRDLYLNQSLIRTLADVSFRLGPNRGGGRRLEIILLEEKFRRPGDKDLGITGVKHLEIFEDVHFEFQAESLQLSDAVALAPNSQSPRPTGVQLTQFTVPLAQADGGAAAWAGGAKKDSVYQPQPGAARPAVAARPAMPAPVHVNCEGSFRVNLVDLTATFFKRVYATQLSFTGQSDQLTCDELAVRFASGALLSPDQDPDFRGTQRDALGKLRPVLLRATGEPVRLDSPSRQAHARGRTLQVDLDHRQVTLDGGAPQVLQAGNEVTAPVIRYQHPEKGDPAAIGKLWLAGPGRLRIASRNGEPADTIEARWNQVPGVEFPVQLLRTDDRPVLLVEGRPSIQGARMGSLTCDRMRVALRETPADGKEGPAIELGGSSPDKLALLPERIDAVGAVVIQSPELTANTHEVTVWVRPVGDQLSLGDAKGNHLVGGAPGEGVGPQRTYTLESQKMQLDLLLGGKRATPADLICEGRVRFAQNPAAGSAEKPLSVAGDRLKVSNLRSGAVEVQVSGTDDPAAIVAQGMTLKAATVMLSQRSNRLWADGAGSAQVNVNRDLFGQSTSAATTLNLTWQGGLNFDGRKITVRENVLGEGPHDWVRCQQVTAAITRPVDFTRPENGRDIQIAQIDCTGGVTLDHRGVDAEGQQSHEHGSIQSVSIDQTTGQITGAGPGWIRSVRLTTGDGSFATLSPTAPKPVGGKRSLQFLRVHFLRGINGNLRNKQLSFLGDVRAVYGPVAGWQQELPLNPPGALPPDTGTLECERLTVNEDPMARVAPVQPKQGDLGPIELHAVGNVKIQGAAEGKGLFTATAGTASYSKSKEEFVLEWDGRSLATIWQQDAPGSTPRKSEAQKLTYWRLIPRVKIENFSRATSGPASARRDAGQAPPR